MAAGFVGAGGQDIIEAERRRQADEAARQRQQQEQFTTQQTTFQQGGFDAPSTGARNVAGGPIQQSTFDANFLAQQQAQRDQQAALLNQQLKEQSGQKTLAAIAKLQGGAQAPRVGDRMGPAADEAAARAAAFARAKDQASATANSALQSLRDVMDARGLFGGSTIEAQQTGNILGGAKGSIDEFTREQLIQDLNRAADVADLNFQGQITQRGQDLSQQQALLGLLAAGGLF